MVSQRIINHTGTSFSDAPFSSRRRRVILYLLAIVVIGYTAEQTPVKPIERVARVVEPLVVNPIERPITSDKRKAGLAANFGGDPTTATGYAIANAAMQWKGKPFLLGQSEMCSRFVRTVLKQAGEQVGVTKKPIDGMLPTNPDVANSYAGEDLGVLITNPKELIPGDIVMWANSYGNYPKGTITHVGIYVGDGMVIDRPTKSGNVAFRKLTAARGTFRVALRLE